MNICKDYHIILENLIAGKINDDEHMKLKNHIDTCSECFELYTTNFALSKMKNPAEKANEVDFNIMRKKVIEKIEKSKENSFSAKLHKAIDYIIENFKKPEYAIAAITLIVGFFLGRALPPDENGLTGGFLKQISSIAEQNIYFSDTQKSSYRFSNVSLKEIDNVFSASRPFFSV